MKELKCANCGNKRLKLDAGVYVCECCGSTFAAGLDDLVRSGNKVEYGVRMFDDGAKYEGNLVAGTCSGQGTITYEDGSKWSGIWKNGQEWDGEGTVFFETATYIGSFRKGKRNGYGKEIYAAGGTWEGEWKDDEEWNGEGTVRFYDDNGNQTGQVYIGKVLGGKFDEKGEWHFNGRWNNFEIQDDVLAAYYGIDEHVVIPNGVSRVRDRCFKYTDAVSIKCPHSVKTFEGSFKTCKKLEYFEAPGLTEISKDLFYQNETIQTVVLQNVKEIPEDAFYGCKKLEEVVIPSATVVRERAFDNSGLERITAPKLRVIEFEAFRNCWFESISLPVVQRIGESAFNNCENLTTAKLPKVKEIDQGAFAFCRQLCEISAPNLEKLGKKGFEFLENLEKVNFPKLQTIGAYAFYCCEALKEVNCPLAVLEPNEKKKYNQFVKCPNLTSIRLHESVNTKHILRDESSGGCYVATAVYGSYDCPEVWTLRRFRDNKLAESWYGRAFIRTYYAASPLLVKWFGHTGWFKKFWKHHLDKLINKLHANGYASTPYEDKNW